MLTVGRARGPAGWEPRPPRAVCGQCGRRRARGVEAGGQRSNPRLPPPLLHQLLSEPRCTPDAARQCARPPEGGKAVLPDEGLPRQPSFSWGHAGKYQGSPRALRAGRLPGGLTRWRSSGKGPKCSPPTVSPRGTAQRSGPTGRVELEGRRRLALQEAVSQGGRQPGSETGSHQPAEGRTAGSGRWDPTMSIFTAFEGWRGLEGTPCLLPTRSKPAKSSSAQPWPRGFAKGQLRL